MSDAGERMKALMREWNLEGARGVELFDQLEADIARALALAHPHVRASFKVDRTGSLSEGLEVRGKITVPLSMVSLKTTEGT